MKTENENRSATSGGQKNTLNRAISYQEAELLKMTEKAKATITGTCPLIEDDAIIWASETIYRYRAALARKLIAFDVF